MISEEQKNNVSKIIADLGMRYMDTCYRCFVERTGGQKEDKIFYLGQITTISDFCDIALGCNKEDAKLLSKYADQLCCKIVLYEKGDEK
jgi:hypothetical protein